MGHVYVYTYTDIYIYMYKFVYIYSIYLYIFIYIYLVYIGNNAVSDATPFYNQDWSFDRYDDWRIDFVGLASLRLDSLENL